MVFIIQKLIGISLNNYQRLIGYNNTPIRSTEAAQLVGYLINNYESLIGYNREGGGYSL